MPTQLSEVPRKVFLNIPYDPQFEKLYLAYIAGVTACNLWPRATLEIPGSQRRLEKILNLIEQCEYSVHDLSRVQLDHSSPRTPRFNMPFELGLTVAWHQQIRVGRGSHMWLMFEAVPYRLEKSLSDLKGTDAHIHGATIKGVFRELLNAFVTEDPLLEGRVPPAIPEMQAIYRDLRSAAPAILQRTGQNSLFSARAFRELTIRARAYMADFVLPARESVNL